MSKKETERRSMASSVMRRAHVLWRKGIRFAVTWSSLLRMCWRLQKNELSAVSSFARGVTFNNRDGSSRQDHLKRIYGLPRGLCWLYLKREIDNQFDPNAIRIETKWFQKNSLQMGYLPKELASALAPQIDQGKEVVVVDYTISQGWNGIYGLRFNYVCI